MKRALDLFSGAGGATRGLQEAGYHVTGVDINPQPRYCGDEFVQADAMKFPLGGYDFIWASPPCQGHTQMNNDKSIHDPTLLPKTRGRLERLNIPWALENVESLSARKAMGKNRNIVILCGSMFGLGVTHGGHRYQLQRHRLVLTPFALATPAHEHSAPVVGVYGGHARNRAAKHGGRATRDPWNHKVVASEAMGIDWMTLSELSEAIPPAYSKYVASCLP